jgi:hypothetical protein
MGGCPKGKLSPISFCGFTRSTASPITSSLPAIFAIEPVFSTGLRVPIGQLVGQVSRMSHAIHARVPEPLLFRAVVG